MATRGEASLGELLLRLFQVILLIDLMFSGILLAAIPLAPAWGRRFFSRNEYLIFFPNLIDRCKPWLG